MIRTNYINIPNFHPAKKLFLIESILCNNSLNISIKTIQTQLIMIIIGFKICRIIIPLQGLVLYCHVYPIKVKRRFTILD